MARGRPAGMYKDKETGLWYMADGTLARSSAAKTNGGTATLTPPVIVRQKPVQTVTEVSTAGHEKPMVQGIHMYSPQEIKRIEEMTGLIYAGSFANSDGTKYSGELVPVLLNPNRGEEERKAMVSKIRKGY